MSLLRSTLTLLAGGALAQLIPLLLEELRGLARLERDQTKQLDDLEHRLERMETIGHIVKDRLDRR